MLGTSAATVRAAPLLLLDVETEEGIVGRAYVVLLSRAAARASIARCCRRRPSSSPASRRAAGRSPPRCERRYALIGVHRHRAHGAVGARHGAVGRARRRRRRCRWRRCSAAAPRPIARLQLLRPRPDGAARRPPTRPSACSKAASEAVKLRLGYADARRGPGGDARRARGACPTTSQLMVDYNQALVASTRRCARGRALQSEGVAWLEEPIRHDD